MDSLVPVEPRGDAANRQRARAEARASFARVGARTEPERLFETGGLRWRFPRSSSPCEAAIVNTGGGVAGGDSYSVSLTLSEGAEVEATTPSAERIYRSDGPAASITTRLVLKPGARLFWLPQETLMFEGARLERRLELDTSGEASLHCGGNAGVRSPGDGRKPDRRQPYETHGAFAVTGGSCSPTRHDWSMLARRSSARRSGRGPVLCRRSSRSAPNIEARLPDLRAALDAAGSDIESGASAIDGLIVVRLLGPSSDRLRVALIASIVALGGRKPRLWP